MGYDPAFLNTANCRSAITFIDGDKGILEYRGYPIEQLAEKSSYLEVAYLLMNGELPTQEAARASSSTSVTHHTYVHENVKTFMDGFRYDAHPMSMLASTVAALSGFYPDAKNIKDAQNRRIQMIRLIAKMPTIAAFCFRHSDGPALRLPGQRSVLRRQLPGDDQEDRHRHLQGEPGRSSTRWTCSSSSTPTTSRTARTTAARAGGQLARWIRSRRSPPGITALYGPLHGGANEAVLRMLREIGHVSKVPEFIKEVKAARARPS